MLKKMFILISIAFIATSCDSALVGGSGICSAYNGERDGFSMSFEQRNIAIPVGEERTVVLNTSWLDSDLVRRPLDCKPSSWESEPDNIVMMDSMKLTALSAGTATVRAVVTGSGGTKTAEFTVTVK